MDLSQRLSENYTLKADLESTRTFVCQGDIARILSASHEHVEFLPFLRVVERTYRDSSARTPSKAVLSNLFKSFGVQQLGCAVSRAREQHGVVV